MAAAAALCGSARGEKNGGVDRHLVNSPLLSFGKLRLLAGARAHEEEQMSVCSCVAETAVRSKDGARTRPRCSYRKRI